MTKIFHHWKTKLSFFIAPEVRRLCFCCRYHWCFCYVTGQQPETWITLQHSQLHVYIPSIPVSFGVVQLAYSGAYPGFWNQDMRKYKNWILQKPDHIRDTCVHVNALIDDSNHLLKSPWDEWLHFLLHTLLYAAQDKQHGSLWALSQNCLNTQLTVMKTEHSAARYRSLRCSQLQCWMFSQTTSYNRPVWSAVWLMELYGNMFSPPRWWSKTLKRVLHVKSKTWHVNCNSLMWYGAATQVGLENSDSGTALKLIR